MGSGDQPRLGNHVGNSHRWPYFSSDDTVEDGADVHIIRVEVFSPALLSGFTQTGGGAAWNGLPPGFAGMPIQPFASQWARDLSDAERASLTALGVDANKVTWWPTVANAMANDRRISAADRLPRDGRVFHC
jgi:hypothetical protein